VNEEGDAVLVLHGLDPAPAGKTYEMWIVPGGDIAAANRAGLFSGRDGSELERLDGTVRAGDVVAVTIEEAAGVDAPTTAPIIASQPV
jgi:anti-sigma-K factor RskA